MPRRRRRRLLPHGLLLALLVGMVVVPALMSLSVGIVALALWSHGFGIVFGVLILSFAAAAIAGGTAAVFFVRRGTRLAELQADFVANVSHELRTPLAGIRLVADTLEAGRGQDPARLAELTEMLGNETRRLEDLVERVLAWRSMDRRAGAPPAQAVEVRSLLDEAIADVARLPEGRQAPVELVVDDRLPPLRADRELLLQAFRNLVHNAVKFGHPSGPVRVQAAREGDQIAISVTDSGPGIPEADLAHIFDRFYRGRASRTRVRGTGLGLDIVRNVVELYGGRVAVESEPGRGTTFTVRLPAGEPEGEDG